MTDAHNADMLATRTSRRLSAGLLLAVLTGCGTTVPLSSSRTVGPDGSVVVGSDGLGSDGLGSDGMRPDGQVASDDAAAAGGPGGTSGTGTLRGGAAGTGTSGAGTSGGRSGSGSNGSATTSAGGGTTPSGPGPRGTVPQRRGNGLGITDTTVSVGIAYTENSDAANSAIGAGAITSGDDRANFQGLVDEINATGGIAGRKLVPVFHAYDATSSSSGSVQDQSACEAWTRDAKVVAVLSGNLTDVLPACLDKAGVAFLKAGALVAEDASYLRARPKQFLLGTMVQDRFLRDLVQSLTRQKYFTGWNTVAGQPGTGQARVAVLSYDTSSFVRPVKGTLLPALAAAGHPVDTSEVFYIAKPASQADVSATTAQIKSATLKMQQNGVTHVVFNDSSGLVMGLFATNANSQAYYPRFGVTSGAGPQGIYDAGLVQSRQLVGMAGNGWLPSIDLPASEGIKYRTAASARCLDILKRRTGQNYTSTNATSIALVACLQVFLVQQGLQAAPELSPAGLVAGIESLKTSFDSPLLPQARLSTTVHDDGVRAWDMSWDTGCNCSRYSSQHEVA